MKHIHVLRTTGDAADFRALFASSSALGVRVGWLDLDTEAGPPPQLEEVAELGVFRVVGVTAKRVVTVKPMHGATVLKDLLREYFVGCRLVVIRGELDAPELLAIPSGYRVRFEDGDEKDFSSDALARALLKPHLRRSAISDPSSREATE